MDPVTMVLLGGGGLLTLITLARPQLLGAAWVRWTGWLRIWERKMVQSKEGYVAIKDKKAGQLRRSSDEIMDGLADLRGKLTRANREHKVLQAREDRFMETRELLLSKAEGLTEGTSEFKQVAEELAVVDKDLVKINSEQETLEGLIKELAEEIELTEPYLDEIEDSIKKTEMERDLGAMKIEVAELKQDRARRLGALSGAGRTYVDNLERTADEYLDKTVERGKLADERTMKGGEAITKKYEKEARAKSGAERLAAELASRRAVKAPPVSAAPVSEGLTK